MTFDSVADFIKKMRLDGAVRVSVSIDEIGSAEHVYNVAVDFAGSPEVKMVVGPDPLPEDPELRAAEEKRRRDALDFHSS